MLEQRALRQLIFTDLDGTLLDHDSYRYDAATPALQRLADQNTPCVINSSKTAREVLPLHRRLGLDAPVIVENGSAVGFPPGSLQWFTEGLALDAASGWHWATLGCRRQEMLPALRNLRQVTGAHFRGFHELSIEQIATVTGLSTEAATLASHRDFSEPLLWEDSPEALQHFSALAAEHGLHAVRGGRFVQVIGVGVDKARALNWCVDSHPAKPVQTIALGDAPNDGAMLAAADIAVWVRSPAHPPGPEKGQLQTLHTQAFGPAGWAEAIHQILDQHEAAHG